jgi:murein DD-endopeptidase MepM/ murein hydrolase activator NlpD
VGRTYRLGQTYCVVGDTHENQLSYDLMLPMGAPVLAARAGTVREIRAEVADDVSDDDAGVHNHVYIEHDDGTTAFYAHLRQNSVLVSVDQSVQAGEQIASSGSSGSDVPLLHFGVYRAYPPTEGNDLPVNFRNADGPLDPLGGLIQDVFYQALPPE